MTKLVIREAIITDLSEILNLYIQTKLAGNKVLSHKEAEVIFERISKYPDYKIYVAFNDNTMVGTFALLVMDNLANQGAKSAIVEDVAVSPDSQGQGVGKRMMNFALEICRNKYCYKLVLSSNVKREKAHEFYEKLGFEKHGYSFKLDLGQGFNKSS